MVDLGLLFVMFRSVQISSGGIHVRGLENGILKNAPNIRPVHRMELQHPQNQPFDLFATINEFQMLRHISDALDLLEIEVGEGSLFGHHEVQQTPQGPNVYFMGLFFLVEDFVCIVLQSATHAVPQVFGTEPGAPPEIPDLHVVILVQEDVLGLQVPVNDVVVVKVFDSKTNLMEDSELLLIRGVLFGDVFEEVLVFAVLHDQIEVALGLERVLEADDVGRVKLRVDVDFLANVLQFLGVGLLHLLHGERPAKSVVFVEDFVDGGSHSLAKEGLFEELYVVQRIKFLHYNKVKCLLERAFIT